MARFVNYKKRGIELPKGCKDLIDVLQEPRRHKTAPTTSGDVFQLWKAAGAKLRRFPKHGLAQIEGYMKRLLDSTSKLSLVSIMAHHPQTEACGLFLFCIEGDLHLVLFLNQHDTERVRTVRALFDSHGNRPAQDYMMFDSKTQVLRYAMPCDAPSIARIVADLLVKGYGLREDDGLDFILHEEKAVV